MVENSIPYTGFYAFDDSTEAEERLLNCCKNVTLPKYNDVANNSDLFVIMHVNCRSIVNKDEDLELLLHSMNCKPQICMLTETWLSSNMPVPQFADFSSYHAFREGRGGGTSIYVQYNLESSIIPCKSVTSFEYVGVIVKINKSTKMLALSVYRPPDNDVNVFLDELEDLFGSLSVTYPDIDKIAVGGDFNINLLENAKHVELFMDLLTSHSMFPSIFKPTRPSSNALLDNIFLSWPSLADSFVLTYDISDHFPIVTRLHNNDVLIESVKDNRYMRVHSETNIASFYTELSFCDWSGVYNTDDVNVACDNFHAAVSSAYNSAFPLQLCHHDGNTNKKRKKPWMTVGLLLSAKTRSQLYRGYLKGKISKEYYNRYHNLLVSLIRRAKREYYNDFFQKNLHNVRAVWSHIRSLKDDSKINPLCANVDDLNNFYADLGPKTVMHTCDNNEYKHFVEHNVNSFVLRDTDYNEIISVCKALRSKSSSGFDSISTKLLQAVIDILAYPLAYICNLSFVHGIYPDLFKIAKVIPIFKGGDKSNLANYRPVSVLPSVSKILERLMYNRMLQFIEKYLLITEWQFGFRPHRSTQDAISHFVEYVTGNLDGKDDVCALFIDVAKAFDSLDHDVLLYKLSAYGFRGNSYAWLNSYLHKRMQYVEVQGHKSALRLLKTGVPQGSILGPLLFLLYINDLVNVSQDTRFILFADDTTCLVAPDKFQNVCNLVSHWFTLNKLCLNVNKTKYMLFSMRNVTPPAVTIMGVNIECVDSVKFLGCVVDNAISWHAHISHVCNKMSHGIALLRYAHNRFLVWVKRLLYFAYVYPHLCYCMAIWGSAAGVHINRVLVMQKCAIRLMLGIGRLDHVKPLAYVNNLLLVPELYEMQLAVNMYKSCVLCYNVDMFSSAGYIPLCDRPTRGGGMHNYYVPYCRTSLRKNCVLHRAVINWNNLSPTLKLTCTNTLSSLKNALFVNLLARYA